MQPDSQDQSSSRLEKILPVGADEAIPGDLAGLWWVAHAKPRNEKAIASELQNLGVFSYLPLRHRETRSRRTRRISRSSIPLFPGYLFFNATDEQRHRALRTNRIVKTLSVANQAQLITELRQIQRLLTTDTGFLMHRDVKLGDYACVLAGPLEGLEGIVTGRLSRMRLVLNVHMLGQAVSVRVAREDIETIEAPLTNSTYPVG